MDAHASASEVERPLGHAPRELGPGADTGLRYVRVRCASTVHDRREQLRCDLAIRVPLGDERSDTTLGARQLRDLGVDEGSRAGARPRARSSQSGAPSSSKIAIAEVSNSAARRR